MRQLVDLLVWFGMVAVLVAVVHYTPKLARYMSSEHSVPQAAAHDSSLALIHTAPTEAAE